MSDPKPASTHARPGRFTPGGLALFVLSVGLVVLASWLSLRSETRTSSRPWVGITWASADTPRVGRTAGMGFGFATSTRPGGIVQMEPDGPGARVGLRVGDRVLSVEGVRAEDDSMLARIEARTVPGDTLAYRVARASDTLVVRVPVETRRHTTRGVVIAIFLLAVALVWWLIGLFVWLRRPADPRATVFGLLCASATSTYVLTPALTPAAAGGGITPAGSLDAQTLLAFGVFALVGVLFSALLLHFALLFPRARPVLRSWREALPWVYAGGAFPILGLLAAIGTLLGPRSIPIPVAIAVALVATLAALLRRGGLAGGIRERLARRPWLAIAALCLIGTAISAAGAALSGPALRPLRALLVTTGLFTPVAAMFLIPLLYGAITIVALLRSYRESGLEQRQQIRWPLFGIVSSLGISLAVAVVAVAAAFVLDAQRLAVVQPWLSAASSVPTVFIPLTFAVAVLRYRLMDLDVVIRRTVIYGAFLGTLALLFVAAIVLAGEVAGRTFGRDTALAGPFATLLVAVVAVPAFRRVRAVLDRRFFRTRYDAGAVLRRIGDAVSQHPGGGGTLPRRIAEELQMALRSRTVALLVRGGNVLVPATALGVAGEKLERLRVPLDDALHAALGRSTHVRADEARGALGEVARLARAELLVPARHQGTLHGVVAVGGKLSDESFTEPDVEFLAAAAGQLAFGLASVETSSQRRELDEAREIQASLLPSRLPEIAGLSLAAHWQPAKHVAGDYYDAFALDAGRLALCVADVTGKGMPAALLMSNLQATVKAFAPHAGGPAALCGRLNRALAGQLTPGRFITFYYGEVDSATRRLRYSNGGHNPPLLLRADGRAEWLDAGGPLLGVVPDAPYAEAEVELSPGDLVVLYTDGVTEAQAPDGGLFGEDRLLASVRAAARDGAVGVQRRLLADAAAYCASEFGDDATVLVVAFT